ncbi:hypothetical protein GCM10027568_07210 [Humibacter soli]
MKHDSITSLPHAPADERRTRMLEYTVMMSIRVLCIVSLIWVRGWWLLIPAAGAVFLPYFAVVVANAVRPRPATPLRPGSILPAGPQAQPTDDHADDGPGDRGDGSDDRGNAGRPTDGTNGSDGGDGGGDSGEDHDGRAS